MKVENLVSITEFANISGYSRAWIYKLIEDGEIKTTTLSGKQYIDKKDYSHIKSD